MEEGKGERGRGRECGEEKVNKEMGTKKWRESVYLREKERERKWRTRKERERETM